MAGLGGGSPLGVQPKRKEKKKKIMVFGPWQGPQEKKKKKKKGACLAVSCGRTTPYGPNTPILFFEVLLFSNFY
jgi:hypothetical protein